MLHGKDVTWLCRFWLKGLTGRSLCMLCAMHAAVLACVNPPCFLHGSSAGGSKETVATAIAAL
jgi:hypothetical protein